MSVFDWRRDNNQIYFAPVKYIFRVAFCFIYGIILGNMANGENSTKSGTDLSRSNGEEDEVVPDLLDGDEALRQIQRRGDEA